MADYMSGQLDALRRAETALWTSLGLSPTEHWLHLPTLDVDVRIQEIGSGPTVLFIHGGSSWGTSWADLAAAMSTFRCLLLDRPGTGLSDPLPAAPRTMLDLQGVADSLVTDVLDALAMPSIDVIATSVGGWFALRSAMSSPASVRRMVIIGWTAGAPVGRLPVALRMGTLPVVGDLAGRLPAGRGAVRSIFRSIGEGPTLDAGRISPEAIDAYAMLLRHTDTFRHERPIGRLLLATPCGSAESPLLTPEQRRRIDTPTLFLWGDADPFGGPDIAAAFVDEFGDARLEVLPGKGHAPWVGDPTGVAHRVAAFLSTG